MAYQPAGKQGKQHRVFKLLVLTFCLSPLLWLAIPLGAHGLGINPGEALLRGTGDWALRAVFAVLAMAPLQQISGWICLGPMRRTVGLFACFYAMLHALIYAWLEIGWSWSAVVHDMRQRPFIAVGVAALGILLAMAASSSSRAIEMLGRQRWKRLHHLLHLAAWLAVLHFYWMRVAKNDVQEVWIYAAVLLLMQAWRIWFWLRHIKMV